MGLIFKIVDGTVSRDSNFPGEKLDFFRATIPIFLPMRMLLAYDE